MDPILFEGAQIYLLRGEGGVRFKPHRTPV
jgi:hypothetical protein